MEEALEWCWPRSRPGEAIVLSPACASTDQFRNFRHRGERFVELVRAVIQSAQSIKSHGDWSIFRREEVFFR